MTGSKKQLRDQHELIEAAQQVAAIAHAVGQRVALVGGLALQIYGSPRLTSDIDVVALDTIDGLRFDKELTFGGYQSHAPNGVPVDVIIRDDDYRALYEAALGFAITVRGIPIHVAQLEYLAAMKLAADRGKDKTDLDFIVTETPIDLAKATSIIRKYMGVYGAQEFKQRTEIAQWKKSTGKL